MLKYPQIRRLNIYKIIELQYHGIEKFMMVSLINILNFSILQNHKYVIMSTSMGFEVFVGHTLNMVASLNIKLHGKIMI